MRPSAGWLEDCGVGDHLPQEVKVANAIPSSRWRTPLPRNLKHDVALPSRGCALALGVQPSLLAAMDAADGDPVGFVEVRDRLAVLVFVDFDDQPTRLPDRVEGQFNGMPSPRADVADGPRVALLALRGVPEQLGK